MKKQAELGTCRQIFLDFLEEVGEDYHFMTMRQIAERLGMHERRVGQLAAEYARKKSVFDALRGEEDKYVRRMHEAFSTTSSNAEAAEMMGMTYNAYVSRLRKLRQNPTYAALFTYRKRGPKSKANRPLLIRIYQRSGPGAITDTLAKQCGYGDRQKALMAIHNHKRRQQMIFKIPKKQRTPNDEL